MSGASPRGAHSEREASAWVREMFGRVARRYDFANHLLSLNMDRGWRRRTVTRVRDVARRPGAQVLDLCCGTGDLTLALALDRRGAIYGSDFCHPMLTGAQPKLSAHAFSGRLFEADALQLPLGAACFDLVTCAFGFRNLASYEAGLREMLRVLRPGGMLAILEFSHPPNALFARAYGLYSRHILPHIGGLLSGARDAYSYLPESVMRFPDADELARRMEAAGFQNVTFERMTSGVVALHIGRKAGS